MPENNYQEIIQNLKNQIDNGTVNKLTIAKDLSISVLTDEHIEAVKTLKEITDITGENPAKIISEMKKNVEEVKKQSYDNKREKAMTEAFGPEKITVNGEEQDNLKRQAAEPYVSKEIQPDEELTKQINLTKQNPIILKFSFQEADVNSDVNNLSDMDTKNKKIYRTSEHVEV